MKSRPKQFALIMTLVGLLTVSLYKIIQNTNPIANNR
jgi:hypothetical protein